MSFAYIVFMDTNRRKDATTALTASRNLSSYRPTGHFARPVKPAIDTRRRLRPSVRSMALLALFIFLAGTLAFMTVPAHAVSGLTETVSWEDIRAGLTTPGQISEFFRSSPIRYKAEKAHTMNHTQPPEETIRTKTGDCEDYAMLITDALIYHGYEAAIISVEAQTPSGLMIHAVAIYSDSDTGRWHYIHGYDFKGLSIEVSKGFDSRRDVALYIAERMNGRLYQYFVMTPDSFVMTYDAMMN